MSVHQRISAKVQQAVGQSPDSSFTRVVAKVLEQVMPQAVAKGLTAVIRKSRITQPLLFKVDGIITRPFATATIRKFRIVHSNPIGFDGIRYQLAVADLEDEL